MTAAGGPVNAGNGRGGWRGEAEATIRVPEAGERPKEQGQPWEGRRPNFNILTPKVNVQVYKVGTTLCM